MRKAKKDPKISIMKSREILDSKGRPMVEVDVWTADGSMGRGSSPCGTSVGRHEAFVLRDGGKRYGGLGVQQAIKNVNEVIYPALKGKSVLDQRGIDKLMIELDGTPNKSRLGANAIYSVSIAVARAAANSQEIPLYRYLGKGEGPVLPLPMFNMINGGLYGDRKVEFQEFILAPTGAGKFSEALRMGVEVFSTLGETIKKRYGQKGLQTGSSAGYAAPADEPAEILEILLEATKAADYAGMFRLGLDCAASHFYNPENKCYNFRGQMRCRDEMIHFLEGLTKSYSLFMIEDPLEEDDFEGYEEITKQLSTLIVGDDLFVTNLERLKRGVAMGAANAMIFKPNMVGTLSEAMDTAAYAKEHGYQLVGSGRAGGGDDPVPEVVVAVGAPLVKFGAPRSGERIAKQNTLLRIEEELGESAQFSGPLLFGHP
ncbi:MAG: phosphopyruvate hydratase [Deltaproteobacteria bacterium RBG_16_49_23]|nr:MAG: phosphopyruvate hydratase [Deltaproteobacteria bacterium RBG_16_49_23]